MITIASCQYQIENLPWDDYVHKIKTLIWQVKAKNAQILLLPEYAGIEIGGYHSTDAELYLAIQAQLPQYYELFSTLACQHHLYIQPGTIPVAIGPQYVNRAYFFGPTGKIGYQDKLQLTEYEKQTGLIKHGETQTLFETNFGLCGIAICYDSEFPAIIRRQVFAGAQFILVPSYTSSLAGFHRVFLSCRARALENQCYVAVSFAVGPIALSEPLEQTTGQAAILGPIESNFSADGIIAEGSMNQVAIVTGQISLEKLTYIREQGEVRNYEDTKRCNDIIHPMLVYTLL